MKNAARAKVAIFGHFAKSMAVTLKRRRRRRGVSIVKLASKKMFKREEMCDLG